MYNDTFAIRQSEAAVDGTTLMESPNVISRAAPVVHHLKAMSQFIDASEIIN